MASVANVQSERPVYPETCPSPATPNKLASSRAVKRWWQLPNWTWRWLIDCIRRLQGAGHRRRAAREPL